MSSKRISHKKKLELLKRSLWKKEVLELAEKYCPEMLDEEVSGEKDISGWVDRFLSKIPESDRQRFVND